MSCSKRADVRKSNASDRLFPGGLPLSCVISPGLFQLNSKMRLQETGVKKLGKRELSIRSRSSKWGRQLLRMGLPDWLSIVSDSYGLARSGDSGVLGVRKWGCIVCHSMTNNRRGQIQPGK